MSRPKWVTVQDDWLLDAERGAIREAARLFEDNDITLELDSRSSGMTSPTLELRVGGYEFSVSAARLRSAETRRLWLEDVFATYFPEVLQRRVEEATSPTDLVFGGSDAAGRALVTDGDGNIVARVAAGHAKVEDGRWIRGDFARAGEHWAELLRALGQTPAAAGAKLRVATVKLGRAHEELAIQASRDIRDRRHRALGADVLIRIPNGGTLLLEPVTDETGIAEVPFRFRREPLDVHGALSLTSPGDPLPIALDGDMDDAVVAYVWALVLCAFATLTTVDDTKVRSGPAASAPRKRGEPFAPDAQPKRLRQRPARIEISSRYGSASISAAGFVQLTGSVAGHRRRLPGGQRCSDEARSAARRVGITLCEGETWVKPHVRGDDTGDGPVELLWTPPAEIQAFNELASVRQ